LDEEQVRHFRPGLLPDFPARDVIDPAVDIFPSDAVTHRSFAWDGMAIEVVQTLTHETIEFSFRASRHLLVAYEEGIRGNGETLIEGLPRSTLRDVKRKLTFVPAGHEYREWQEPRTRSRIVYLYFDFAKMPLDVRTGAPHTPLAPRLFFEDNALWETAVKMAALVESSTENRHYCAALGIVLVHELVRRNAGTRRVEPPARGGLAAWQQRIVSAYIRRTRRRTDTARHARAARSAEPISFLPRLQAIVRHAAPPLPQRAAHRARQDAVGAAHVLDHPNRAEGRLQRNEFVHGSLSQGDRIDADRLPPKPWIVGTQ
jgi:hypothetical protein